MNTLKRTMLFSIGLLSSLTFLGFVTQNDHSRAESKDTIAPKIEHIADCTLTLKKAKEFDPLKNVQAFDNIDGNLTEKITLDSYLKKDTVGKYRLIYSVTDRSGNKTTKIRTVTIIPDEETSSSAEQTAPIESVPTETEAPIVEEAQEVIEAVEPTADSTPVESEAVPIEQNVAPTAEPTPTPEPVISQQNATISFLGVTIPFINYNGASAAPASGAGTWTGTGAVNDGAPTHFIGHNPGDFAPVMNITVGTPITVVDGQGNARTYTVYEVLDAYDDGLNAHDPNDNTWARVIDAGGERISLQTCITDSINRIVLAS
ncbi:immunoglobulin-like domain-containing protein [uncultured Enterococcus sp.]|uniref:immunoglobulin-like domain-containing protein n=1 Tax=uncultured Enterococcus sp. TaxID=167972 RepID=UPI002AA7C3F0|nr:immunoglobulin-like domain-containing protein [uncultured Enterococcus sp.]